MAVYKCWDKPPWPSFLKSLHSNYKVAQSIDWEAFRPRLDDARESMDAAIGAAEAYVGYHMASVETLIQHLEQTSPEYIGVWMHWFFRLAPFLRAQDPSVEARNVLSEEIMTVQFAIQPQQRRAALLNILRTHIVDADKATDDMMMYFTCLDEGQSEIPEFDLQMLLQTSAQCGVNALQASEILDTLLQSPQVVQNHPRSGDVHYRPLGPIVLSIDYDNALNRSTEPEQEPESAEDINALPVHELGLEEVPVADLDPEADCGVCLEPLTAQPAGRLNCPAQHMGHIECLAEWSRTQLKDGNGMTCGYCRGSVTPRDAPS